MENTRVSGERTKAAVRRNSAVYARWAQKLLFYCGAAVCTALIVWCFGDHLVPYLRDNGDRLLRLAVGIQQETANTETKRYADVLQNGFESGETVDLWQEAQPEVQPKATATPDPSRETGTVEVLKMSAGQPVDCFTVKDETGTGLNLEEELKIDPNITVKRDGTPVVLLYSTHTTESYILEDGADWYYLDDDFRSLNLEETVVSVAAEAAKVIEDGGFGVVHDKTVHDNPAYSGSYARSMETVQKNLEQYPTIRITVDVHRDAFGESGAVRYKPVAEVDGEQAAQIMILTGCDTSEDPLFPDWRENLHLALRLQQAGETLFPGLYRPLYFCNRNYNMHATHGSLLIEVGTDVNTLEEARYSGRLLGETILKVLNDLAEKNA